MEPSAAAAEPRRLRADAARNRQRLIDAAEEVFAARGLDATCGTVATWATACLMSVA
jgi:DNA-binding transcriptional regulator YbjK